MSLRQQRIQAAIPEAMKLNNNTHMLTKACPAYGILALICFRVVSFNDYSIPILQFNSEYRSQHKEKTKRHHQNSGNLGNNALISGSTDSINYASHD